MGKIFSFFWFIVIKIRKFYLFNIIMFFIVEGCNIISSDQDITTYPDVISPIYYIDTFQIKSPRIAFIDSVAYIFSLDKLEPFKSKEDFINQKGVIQYLTMDIHVDRYIGYLGAFHKREKGCNSFSDLAQENDFYWDELFSPCENIEGISVYRFVFEPKTFLLTIISDDFNVELDILPLEESPDSCYSVPAVFSMNYSLAIMPIYNKNDLKKIKALYYRYVYGKNCKE
jgi:hypothetical protein